MFGPVRITSWCAGAVERDVVRHERVGDVPLDDRMAHVGGDELVAGVHQRLGVVLDGGGFGQRAQHVERGEARAPCPGSAAPPPRPAVRSASNSSTSRSTNPLVGAEHLLLVLLQRRGDEALAAGDRLLAMVVGRHACRGSTSRPRCSSRRRGCSGSSATRSRCAPARLPPSRRCAACRTG